MVRGPIASATPGNSCWTSAGGSTRCPRTPPICRPSRTKPSRRNGVHHAGCEQNGDNPNITLAAKASGSPINKGLPGPGLLAYVVTSKFGDYLPLHRLQHIFARQGFELDRSTMCLWLADVARLLRPLYDRMVQRALQSRVLATDDTEMPLLQPGKTKKARMWIYRGDDAHPYNVFAFTASRKRDGPAQFLRDFRGTLLPDAYGDYDGIVLNQDLPRAGCWAHARRKFVDNETAAILSSLTSTCRRHEINPQAYLTQPLANLPDTPINRVDNWLPDRWKKTSAIPPAPSSPTQP